MFLLYIFQQSWALVWLSIWFYLATLVSANPTEKPFPDITFKLFAQVVSSNFGSSISLATVLMLLFTLTENVDLLNLHFRQQHPQFSGENSTQVTGWMTALTKTILSQLSSKRKRSLFQYANIEADEESQLLATQLEILAKALDLSPYNDEGNYSGKLVPISTQKIQPIHIICPRSFVCSTATCRPRSLVQATRSRDIPNVTFIKNQTIFKNVPVLTGTCPRCKTSYHADHERYLGTSGVVQSTKRAYLNSAKYLKIGSNIWVDRLFSTAAVNAMYNFHASPSAYAEYWNNTYGTDSTSLSRAHMWQAFVQESLRTIAAESNTDLELDDALDIKEVTAQAFSLLGENGMIRAADQHACSECTQEYKEASDVALNNNPAAIVGVDRDESVPPLADMPSLSPNSEDDAASSSMDLDKKFVKMIVLDGIVMGPTVNDFN